jgi:hypothetical protein
MRFWLAFILALYVGTADARPRGAPNNVPQIFYNIVSDAGAACNGDVQTVTKTISITSGANSLSVSSGTFINAAAPTGDIGKTITIDGAGSGGGRYYGVINAVSGTGSQTLTLSANAATTVTAASKSMTYGTADQAAFATFNTWAIANQGTNNQVVLTIPPGANCWFGSGGFGVISVFNPWAAGIKNLVVEGTGATINSVGGQTFQLGGLGMCFRGLTAPSPPGCDARLQAVSAGASTVTLSTASAAAGYISRFSVGMRVMVGGLDPQAIFTPGQGFGDPTNLTYFEWRTIVSCNAAPTTCTGTTITLDSPLVDAYSASWPEYNAGDQFHSDGAGPATIWAMDSTWETTVEYRGLTISQEGQTYAQGRNVTYRNVTFTGDHGGIPTQNETFSAIGTNYGTTNMETDKLVGTMLFDGVTIAQVVNQSTSTKRLIIRNSNITLRLDGGAQYTEISDTTMTNFGPGIFAYGNTGTSNQTICTRCVINTLNYDMSYNSGSDAFWSKSGGTITMPNAGAQGSGPGQRYFAPGARVYYVGGTTNPPTNPLFSCCESLGSFAVTTVTSDPWPATDNQTVAATVTIPTSGNSNRLTVGSGIFVSGDVGKTIIVNGAGNGGGPLRTWITAFNSATDVVLYNAATSSLVGSSQTVQWGTSNTYIATNQSGAFPDVSAFSSNVPGIGFKVSGSWNFTCDTCSGTDGNAAGASIQAGATPGKPLGSFISKSYTPTSAQGNLALVPGRGVFKSLRINVTVAATSAGAVTLNPGGRFHWYMLDQVSYPTSLATFDWLPANLSINLKQTGDRVITSSGVTCNGGAGACAGDVITRPGNLATMWIQQGAMTPWMGDTHTGAPAFSITLQTDPLQ